MAGFLDVPTRAGLRRRAEPEHADRVGDRRQVAWRAVFIGALGVVFGDIGTSPIYTVQTVFSPGDPHPVAGHAKTACLGIASLIFWSVTIVVTVTYVLLVMRADNHGEGGIMALITLIAVVPAGAADEGGPGRAGDLRRVAVPGRQHDHAGHLGAVGGRGPQGRRRRRCSDLVVPITAAIIIALFLVQRRGTASRRAGVRAGHARLVRRHRRVRRRGHRRAPGASSGRCPRPTRSTSSSATSGPRSSPSRPSCWR